MLCSKCRGNVSPSAMTCPTCGFVFMETKKPLKVDDENENDDWAELMGANEEGIYEGDSEYKDFGDILENIADTYDEQ